MYQGRANLSITEATSETGAKDGTAAHHSLVHRRIFRRHARRSSAVPLKISRVAGPPYPRAFNAVTSRAKSIGPEFERMAREGSVTPDLWMKHATGAPVGPQALLKSAAKALDVVK